MAALIEQLVQGDLRPDDLLRWLDGVSTDTIPQELLPFRVEFVPVFLNYLREQSSSVLQSSSEVTPSKVPSSVRVTKYVSPRKAPASRGNQRRRQHCSSRAKSLMFAESSSKEATSSSDESKVPAVEQLLRESSLPGDSWGGAGPRVSLREKTHRSKRHSLEGADHRGKHSEQRLVLGDFITSGVKQSKKKGSHLQGITSPPADSRAGGNSWSLRRQESPQVLDLSDQEAFPVVGATPSPQDRQSKRRINPTRILSPPSSGTSTQHHSKVKLFGEGSKAVFGVPYCQSPCSPFLAGEGAGSSSLEEERELLRLERLKRQGGGGVNGGKPEKLVAQESPPNQVVQKPAERTADHFKALPDLVTNHSCLDALAEVYANLILHSFAPNLMVELYYTLQLLTVPVTEEAEESSSSLLGTAHNCVYFATGVLLRVASLLKLLDRGALKLLSENPRVAAFSEELHRLLLEHLERPPPAPFLTQAPKSPIGGVSFQSDTDNRNNFPSDQAFHLFRKQRDSFYEMLRVWEEGHLTPGWSFSHTLASRIHYLLQISPSPTNLVHFARLFQSQLLAMCRGDDDQCHPNQDQEVLGVLTVLRRQHPEKYKRLYERLVTPAQLGGPCPAPSFSGSQEFFKDFIITAASFTFNQHLKDVLVSQILMLSEQQFLTMEQEEGDPVDNMVREEARSVVLNLRLLAKFLGFLEFLPYQTSEHLQENVLASQIALRSKVCPPVSLCGALRRCAAAGQLVVGVTWVVELLSMVDPVALHTYHYLTVVMALREVLRLLHVARRPEGGTGCSSCGRACAGKTFAPSNSLLLKLLLGWLFDLPNFPDGLFFVEVSEADIDHQEYSLTLSTLNTHYSRLCAACLSLMLHTVPSKPEKEIPQLSQDAMSVGEMSPTKNCNPHPQALEDTQTCTPSKHVLQGAAFSPLKTPSKALVMSMVETPQVTPLKGSDTQVATETTHTLDEALFVDHQMITLCCPFVSELKNLLSDSLLGVAGSNKGASTFRKITPHSASDKSVHSHLQLQMQLEDNFFHNQPTSVRKTTDFVVERVSSNVIKTLRCQVLPSLREAAMEKLKAVIAEQFQSTPQGGERVRDLVRQQVVEVGREVSEEARARCAQITHQHCNGEVEPALALLLPPDISPQGVEVCRKLVSRCSREKVAAWVQSHLTPTLFCKDLTADADRLIRQAQKAADLQAAAQQTSSTDVTPSNSECVEVCPGVVVMDVSTPSHSRTPQSPLDHSFSSPVHQPRQLQLLSKKATTPPEGLPLKAKEHLPEAPAPSMVLNTIKSILREVTSSPGSDLSGLVTRELLLAITGDVRRSLSQRQDVLLTAHRALETLTVDLLVVMAVCVPPLITSEIQEEFVSLWRPVALGGVLPSPACLGSILCPRTVMLVAQNPNVAHQKLSWKKIEELICLLLTTELLTPATLLDHSVALLRHSWPQEILSGISVCIEGVTRTALKQKEFQDDSTLMQMLDWVGWVCEQMDDLGEDF
ncbi:codanin-1-like isoform X3 [Scylla paramamosain]|uniref:codanin-1-like isoform X3 n=1 Tax=Scylla paramamosain TaxID=85552 RepID=UPI003082D558